MKLISRIALGALLASTALAEPAHAFFIVPAIVGFIGITGVAATLVTAAIEIGAAVGLSYLAKALTPKPNTPDLTQQPGGTSGKLSFGGAVSRSFVVGQYATAGSLVYANTYSPSVAKDANGGILQIFGALVAAGTTPNAYLTQVIALSDLPVTGLAGVLVNGVAVTYNSGATPSFEGIAIPEYNKDGIDYLWVRFYDGTQSAADSQLVAMFGADANRPYGSDRVGHGIAYAVITARVNEKLFTGFPAFKFVLNGVKLYDRRHDSSAGGSGSQRWSTPSTWAYTSNPGVIAENILRGISYSGTWLYGAQTVSNAQIPIASWGAAQSECDVAIDLAAGGTEPQFVAGGEISVDHQPADTLDELLKSCNGRLAEIGGTYKLRVGAAGAAVFTFSDSDILSTEQQTFDPFPSLGKVVNAVTAKYVSPADGWNTKDAPPLYDSTLETADGGRRQPVNVQYSFVTSGTQVQRLMKAERDTQRAFRRHSLPMPPDAFVLEPLDVISWTSTRNGYVAKTFDITAMDDLPNLNVGISIQELDPNAYDWTPLTDEQPISNGPLALLFTPTQPIVDWSALPWTIHSDTDQDRAAIKLNWDPNTDDVDGIRYEVRLTSTAEVVLKGSYSDRIKAGAIIVSQNILGNTHYQARGQYVPISERDTSWSSWLDVTTPDVRVTLTSFQEGLRDYVTNQFTSTSDLLDALLQKIASYAAEQDAANWNDKYDAKLKAQDIRDSLADTDAQVVVIQQNRVTDLAALAAYQVTVATRFTNVDTSIATAQSTAISTAESYADGAVATYSISADATFATKTALTNASASTLATAEAFTTGAIATYTATVNATFATKQNLSDASATTLLSAKSYADGAIADYNVTVQATYWTASTTSSAIALAKTDVQSYSDRALATYDISIQATYSTKTDTDAKISTAKVSAVATALANTNSAVSTYDQSVFASVGGLQAKVTQESIAVADLNGFAAAAWAVKLNANGYVAGIQLVNGGSGSSAFQISADVFQVAWPGVSGGSPVPVFQIANVNGVSKLVFRGDMYADGSINVGALNAATLTAIRADFGTATVAGTLSSRNSGARMVLDFTNNRIVLYDA